MSSAYVSGPRIEDALAACGALDERGYSSTVCYWNSGGDPPDQVAAAYLAAVAALSASATDTCLSVKVPALEFSPELVGRVLADARANEVPVHIDALSLESAPGTVALLHEAAAAHPDLGVTLPSIWSRSVEDAELALELDLSVRVTKGQWPADGSQAVDAETGFLRLVDRLAGRARKVAIATHDPSLAREALGRLLATGTPCELEQLFGLAPHRAVRVAYESSVPVRVYVPYGRPMAPYRPRNAARDPRVLWWGAQDLALGRNKGWRYLDRLRPLAAAPRALASTGLSSSPPNA